MVLAVLVGLASAGQETFPGRNGRLAYDLGGIVYTVNPDGSDRRAVTDPRTFSPRDPAWSADGSRIAFQNSRGQTGGVWTIGADGTAPRRVTKGSPDTGRL